MLFHCGSWCLGLGCGEESDSACGLLPATGAVQGGRLCVLMMPAHPATSTKNPVPPEPGWGSEHHPGTSSTWEPVRKAESRALPQASRISLPGNKIPGGLCASQRGGALAWVTVFFFFFFFLGDRVLEHIVQMHCRALATSKPLSPPLPHLRRGEVGQGANETEAKPKLGA